MRRGRLEADEEEDAEEHAAEDAASLDPEPRRLPRVEHRERDAVLPALRDDHDPEDQHRNERDRREGQHRADGDPDPDVVQREHDRERDERPDPPIRAGRRDVRRPELVGENAEPEVDPAAAEEQHADEEEPGRDDAEPRMRAVGEVLVHRARAGEAAGIERDDVADREHAEGRDDDRERRVPAGADVGSRDPAEDQRHGEHRPDRERLGDGVQRRELLVPQRSGAAGGVGLAHPDGSSSGIRRPLRRGRRWYTRFEHRMSTLDAHE